eukprot:CAMPEP_0170198876 /NCGR_PEP_ID=MMETSP0040_2-20121228/69024_1 /TAXON_ID=641309 /ORGANISM="Lotharella oceanica, Strain CCMP622" /LENGTH=199 /DNA_ID=CAMNT_0010448939 /DNA_START=53 /DNA_END=653 /DNA_ORIENTATION=+
MPAAFVASALRCVLRCNGGDVHHIVRGTTTDFASSSCAGLVVLASPGLACDEIPKVSEAEDDPATHAVGRCRAILDLDMFFIEDSNALLPEADDDLVAPSEPPSAVRCRTLLFLVRGELSKVSFSVTGLMFSVMLSSFVSADSAEFPLRCVPVCVPVAFVKAVISAADSRGDGNRLELLLASLISLPSGMVETSLGCVF